jgi:hypothetical protein
VTALNAESSVVNCTAERLHSTSAPTRVLYLTSSALTGAVLYLLVSWPHSHVRVQAAPPAPVAEIPAPAAERIPTMSAQKPPEIAVPAMLEAVRAVAGTAQAREAAVIAAAAQTSIPANQGSHAAASGSPAGSTGSQSTVTTAAPEPQQSNSITSAAASSFTGASVDARQPAIVSASPNHIGVPGSQPAAAPGNGTSPATSTNRIAIPATPPH